NLRMKPLELNVAQFGLMSAVAKMPGQSLSAIAEAMLLDESTMVRNFTVLERRGLMVAEGGRGRGGKQVSLTMEGEELYRAGSKIWRLANAALERAMGLRDAEAVRGTLEKLGDVAERLRSKEAAEAMALAGED